jgi:hypothetical protein
MGPFYAQQRFFRANNQNSGACCVSIKIGKSVLYWGVESIHALYVCTVHLQDVLDSHEELIVTEFKLVL